MSRSNLLRGLAGMVATLGLVAACGSDDPDKTEAGPPSAPQSTTAPGELPEPETTELTIGLSGLGPSYLGMLAAVEKLNADGWDIEIAELSSGDLMIQGVDSGQFQLGAGSMPSVMLAVEKDRPLKMYMDLVRLDWTAYGTSDLKSCEDLDDKIYAVHSESSITNLLPRHWIEENCPDAKPEFIIIPGSENRLVALEAGEIDATSLELADAIQLDHETNGEFNRITFFADELPNLVGATHFGNSKFMEENPGTMANFIAAMLEAQRSFEDPAKIREAFLTLLPEYEDGPVLDAISEQYAELGMFDPDGGFSAEAMKATLDFYQSSGQVGDSLSVDDLVDRSYLETAVAALDG